MRSSARAFLSVLLRNPGLIIDLALTYWLLREMQRSAGFRIFLVHAAQALLNGAHAAWALLQIDTRGTLAALGLTLLKMLPGLVPLVVLAARLKWWERVLRLPLWALLLPLLGPLACIVPWTPIRFGVMVVLGVAAVWLTKYRWLRWTILLPLAMYLDIFVLHLLSHVGAPLPLNPERCRHNDGQRPLNLQNDQVGPCYYSVALLNNDQLLLTANVPKGANPPGKFSSWWLRRQGDGWVFDGRSAAAGDLENGCLMQHELWFNDSMPDPGGNDIVGVSRDPVSGKESVRILKLGVECNNLHPPVCRPERRSLIVSEAVSGNRMWDVSTDTGTVRQMGYEPGALMWAARGHRGDYLTINDFSDLMVYSLEDERVSQRIPAGVFMFNRHETCSLDDEVATADMTGRLRLFARGADGRYTFDWGIALPAPRFIAFSPDCRFLGVTSMDDTTVTLVERATRTVVATYHVGPALREITFLGPRELAVTDACTVTTFRF